MYKKNQKVIGSHQGFEFYMLSDICQEKKVNIATHTE
jgi:hypothetical protein